MGQVSSDVEKRRREELQIAGVMWYDRLSCDL